MKFSLVKACWLNEETWFMPVWQFDHKIQDTIRNVKYLAFLSDWFQRVLNMFMKYSKPNVLFFVSRVIYSWWKSQDYLILMKTSSIKRESFRKLIKLWWWCEKLYAYTAHFIRHSKHSGIWVCRLFSVKGRFCVFIWILMFKFSYSQLQQHTSSLSQFQQ